MMKRKNKIEIFSLLTLILLIFLIGIYIYFLIENELNVIKLNIEKTLSDKVNYTIKIKKLKPYMFWGIKLYNIEILDNNNEIASIKSIIIKIKLKDILTKKIDITKSIYRIIVNNSTLHLKYQNKKWNISNLLKKDTNKTNSMPSAIIELNNSKIFINYNNHKVIIIGEEGEVNLQNLKFYYSGKVYYPSFSISSSFLINGKEKTNSIYSILFFKDIKLKDKVIYNNTLFIETEAKKRDIFFNGGDEINSLKFNGKLSKKSFFLYYKIKKMIISDYKIYGKGFLNNKKGNIKINIKNLKNKNIYNFDITKKHSIYYLKKILIKEKSNNFIKVTGKFRDTKNYLLKLWFNNYKYKNFNLYGKNIIFTDKNKNIKFELINFHINRLKIRHIKLKIIKENRKYKALTVISKDNLKLNIIKPVLKNKLFFQILFNNYPIKNINKLLLKDIIDDRLNGKLSGYIDFSLYNSLKNIRIKNYLLNLKFNTEESFLKKIKSELKFIKDGRLLKIKVYTKKNKLIDIVNILTSSKNNYDIYSYITYKNNIYKIKSKIYNKNSYQKIIMNSKNILNINGNLYKNGNFFFSIKLTKKNYSIIKSLQSICYIKGNYHSLNSIEYNGRFYISNIFQDKLNFNFHNKKHIIIFKNIKFKHKKLSLYGKGDYNIKSGKLNINLKNFLIKGILTPDKTNLDIILNKIKNINIKNIIYNINGIININTKKNFSKPYIKSYINFYNIRYKNFKIEDIYFSSYIKNSKINIKKLDLELYNGKAKLKNINFFKFHNKMYSEFTVRLNNIKFKNYLLNGKVYSKINISDLNFLKLKIIKLSINNMKIKNVEEIISKKNKIITISQIGSTGIEGKIKLIKPEYIKFNLKGNLLKNKIFYIGEIKNNYINSSLKTKNFKIKTLSHLFDYPKIKDGLLSFQLNFRGKKSNPLISGIIKGKNFYIIPRDIIPKIKKLNFIINIDKNIATINKLKGESKGPFALTGNIDFTPTLSNINLNLLFKTLNNKGIYLSSNNGEINGNIKSILQINGPLNNLNIKGKLILDNFEFTWPLSFLPGEDEGKEKNNSLNFNIIIIAGNNVKFFQGRNNLNILIKKGGKLSIKGDLASEHRVIGKLEAEKGGLDYFGTYFRLQYASVTFSEAYEENIPWISAKAEAKVRNKNNEDIVITMVVEGLADNDLTPRLYSSPALSSREIFLLLNNSSYYLNTSNNGNSTDNQIEELLKLGFLQIFYTTYQEKFLAPLQRSIKKSLGLDILNIKTEILQNLLEPTFYRSSSSYYNNSSLNFEQMINNTEISIGKYIGNNMLIKYSLLFKENPNLSHLYYFHQIGIEMKLFNYLNFEWLYKPVFLDEYNLNNEYEQKFKLEWKRKINF